MYTCLYVCMYVCMYAHLWACTYSTKTYNTPLVKRTIEHTGIADTPT